MYIFKTLPSRFTFLAPKGVPGGHTIAGGGRIGIAGGITTLLWFAGRSDAQGCCGFGIKGS